MITCIDTLDAFSEKREFWTELWMKNACDSTVFQSFEWNYHSWDLFLKSNPQNRLQILVYSSESDVSQKAIFPFYIDKRGCLRFINDIHSDFCDALWQIHESKYYTVVQEVFQHIESNSIIRYVLLDNMLWGSPLLSYLKVFSKNAWIYSQTEHSYLKYKQSQNYLNAFEYLTSSARNKIKNIYKETNGLKFFVYQVATRHFPKEHLINLRNAMIERKIRGNEFMDQKFMNLVELLYEKNMVEIPFLFSVDGTPLAAGFRFSNAARLRTMAWIVMFIEHKMNTWTHLKYIEFKVNNGSGVYDFGRGGYDYKMQRFHPQIENLYRFMYSKTLFGNVWIILRTSVSHLRKTIKKHFVK